MPDCPICSQIERGVGVIAKSKEVAVLIPSAPCAPGHVILTPIKHASIMEQIPPQVVSEMFVRGNVISLALFEALGAHGTNMFIENGLPAGQMLPHAVMHVIPRKEGDGLKLEWNAKELSEEEMASVEIKLKEGIQTQAAPAPKPEAKKEQPEEKQKRDNTYILRALRRIP